MISFKTKEDLLPSALIIASIVAVISVLIFSILFPIPSVSSIANESTAQQNRLFTESLLDKKEADLSRASIAARIWKGDENHVGASVLAQVTKSTASNGIKLTAFRPQRTIDLDGIVELPYTLQLAGPYPGIREVMRDIDKSNSKVVLRSIQVSASEEETGSVTATLGISAYIASDPTIASDAGKGTNDDSEVH